jgi:hypothetical protein
MEELHEIDEGSSDEDSDEEERTRIAMMRRGRGQR